MRRELIVVIGVICLLTGSLAAQSTLVIRAASTIPVAGWPQMDSADRGRSLWVAPENDLTSADIERAEQVTGPDGSPALTIVFTDDGAKKIAALSTTQLGQPIAFLLDGTLISAPVVRARIEKESVLSGGPGGLTPDEIKRLLTILKRR